MAAETSVSASDEIGSPGGPQPHEEALVRADEQQRIARELHDSTSQLLVVLQLELRRLKHLGRDETARLIEECESTIEEIRRQIRNLTGDYD